MRKTKTIKNNGKTVCLCLAIIVVACQWKLIERALWNHKRITKEWFIFRTKCRINIILSFGHCFAKIDKRGGVLIRAGGWIKFLKINKRPPLY